jgi:hypothetical protein
LLLNLAPLFQPAVVPTSQSCRPMWRCSL